MLAPHLKLWGRGFWETTAESSRQVLWSLRDTVNWGDFYARKILMEGDRLARWLCGAARRVVVSGSACPPRDQEGRG